MSLSPLHANTRSADSWAVNQMLRDLEVFTNIYLYIGVFKENLQLLTVRLFSNKSLLFSLVVKVLEDFENLHFCCESIFFSVSPFLSVQSIPVLYQFKCCLSELSFAFCSNICKFSPYIKSLNVLSL